MSAVRKFVCAAGHTVSYEKCMHCGAGPSGTCGQYASKLEHQKSELLAICNIFLGGDERFQIAVGGNPIAVDKMLADARALVAKVAGDP